MSTASTDQDYAPFAGSYVDRILEFAQEFSRQYGPDPEPGSIADREIYGSSESGPGGAWPGTELQRPYDIAGGLCILCLSHFVRSLRLLLVPDMALYGFQSVTRSIIESATRAAWVLDRNIGGRERVVRSFLLELDSITESKKVERAAGGDGSGFNQKIFDLKVRLALLGLDEQLNARGVLKGIESTHLPNKTTAVSEFLPLLGVVQGEMWYRLISGVTHSVLYGLTQYLSASLPTSVSRTIPTPELPLHAVANAVVLSLDAYLYTVECHATLWGRDSAAVAGKRLEMKGDLLSALNRPELRVQRAG